MHVSFRLMKALNKYYQNKYGKNFERLETNYELIYKLHYILCIFQLFMFTV